MILATKGLVIVGRLLWFVFVFDLDFDPFYLEIRYLSFLVLTGYLENAAKGENLVGLTYCLEAGVLRWYGTPSSQSSLLHLRQNKILRNRASTIGRRAWACMRPWSSR